MEGFHENFASLFLINFHDILPFS